MARRSGRHGRRKVNVPNVVGTSRTAARGSFTTIELNYSESSINTSEASLSQITESQAISGGQTVLIGSTIPFTYYNYVAPTPVPVPVAPTPVPAAPTPAPTPVPAAPTPAPTPVPAAPTPTPAPTPAAPTPPPAPTPAAPTPAPTPTPAAPTPAPTPTPAAPTPTPAASGGCTVGAVCGETYYSQGQSGCSCYEGCYRLKRYNSSCNCVNSGGLIC